MFARLGGWLVQDVPLELAVCECCMEVDCTNSRYETCELRLRLQAQIAAQHGDNDEQAESGVRVKGDAVGSDLYRIDPRWLKKR